MFDVIIQSRQTIQVMGYTDIVVSMGNKCHPRLSATRGKKGGPALKPVVSLVVPKYTVIAGSMSPVVRWTLMVGASPELAQKK